MREHRLRMPARDGHVHAAINSMVPCIVNELNKGKKWEDIKATKLTMLRQRMMIQDV